MHAPHTTAEPVGLREQKKAATRQALIEVSQRLFATKGYAATTLEEICTEVGIRPQTLLRYFESKAHLATAPLAAVVADLERKVTEPERTADTIELWREHVAARTIFHQMHSPRAVRTYYRWLDADPVLLAMTAQLNHRTQTVLAAGLAHDHHVEPDDLHSTMLAALLVAGWNSIFLQWLESGGDADELGRRQDAVVDFAVSNLPRSSASDLGADLT
ncbi:MAG: TetR/AcrR family transcriptional regulator [Acidimicrobiales bacterium]|nr:TetR/AcrR family transcriptional regulator [Acidimicrobiales bacterium]